ncbi:uncharacterized protein LOC133910079 isoform X3 [Phragmites australis]|uniref:uncharacterized protein LOC133910079 isoform X3 n=1 Tax=Phragmites australis TaxID=29695 RepID=UPI002D79C238|nr:uncharacterized protein LOC133910079 isoform X3 [Phragmites australis]
MAAEESELGSPSTAPPPPPKRQKIEPPRRRAYLNLPVFTKGKHSAVQFMFCRSFTDSYANPNRNRPSQVALDKDKLAASSNSLVCPDTFQVRY